MEKARLELELDRADIEALGWKNGVEMGSLHSEDGKFLLFVFGVHDGRRGFELMWFHAKQKHLFELRKTEVVDGISCSVGTLFRGRLENKSELAVLMRQVGINRTLLENEKSGQPEPPKFDESQLVHLINYDILKRWGFLWAGRSDYHPAIQIWMIERPAIKANTVLSYTTHRTEKSHGWFNLEYNVVMDVWELRLVKKDNEPYYELFMGEGTKFKGRIQSDAHLDVILQCCIGNPHGSTTINKEV